MREAVHVPELFPIPTPGVADQRLTVDATAGGVQFSAFDAKTKYVVLDVQTADVMVTFDGSAPTTTNGHLLYVGDHRQWNKVTAAAAKFIRAGSTSGVIHASEFSC